MDKDIVLLQKPQSVYVQIVVLSLTDKRQEVHIKQTAFLDYGLNTLDNLISIFFIEFILFGISEVRDLMHRVKELFGNNLFRVDKVDKFDAVSLAHCTDHIPISRDIQI